VNKGDIFWVQIPERLPPGRETAKSRPCVIVSATLINASKRSTVVCVPLSTNKNEYPPFSVRMESAGTDSVAICDQLFAVDKARLGRKAGALHGTDLDLLDGLIRQILAL
jgi:mRNA interferase MazF